MHHKQRRKSRVIHQGQAKPGQHGEGHAEKRAPKRHHKPMPARRCNPGNQGGRCHHNRQMRQAFKHTGDQQPFQRCAARQQGRLPQRQHAAEAKAPNQTATQADARAQNPGNHPQHNAHAAHQRERQTQLRARLRVKRAKPVKGHTDLAVLRCSAKAGEPNHRHQKGCAPIAQRITRLMCYRICHPADPAPQSDQGPAPFGCSTQGPEQAKSRT